MTHAEQLEPQHPLGRHSPQGGLDTLDADPRNRGKAFLLDEIESDRRGERALIWKALIAFAIAAALVAVRELFFS
jgi:hypothetical protein